MWLIQIFQDPVSERMNKLDEIILAIRTHLPRWRFPQIKHLGIQIWSINRGKRPAFLWDKLPNLGLDILKDLLTTLLDNRIITREIQVITMAEEIFLINREELINGLNSHRFLFLDILPEGDKFNLINRNKDITVLVHQLQANAIDLSFSDDPTTNLATISGLILDYPVVYYSNHGLDIRDARLMVYKVLTSDQWILYSFSVPADILTNDESIRKHIEKWKTRLTGMGLTIESQVVFVESCVL